MQQQHEEHCLKRKMLVWTISGAILITLAAAAISHGGWFLNL